MAGVFGAGVFNTLEKHNVYERVESIYAASAGAFNAAFFLTRQTDLGASIYFKEATRDFICPRNLIPSFFQQFWSRHIHRLPSHKIRQVLDMDYIIEVLKSKKPLNTALLVEQKIPLYVRLLDVKSGNIKYLDARSYDPLRVLKAAGSIIPWYSVPQKINGRSYIDGALKESIGLRYVFEKYPRHKSVFIYNEPLHRRWWYHLHNIAMYMISMVFSEFYKILPLSEIYKNKETLVRQDLELALKNKRVLLVSPPTDSPTTPITRDPKKLRATFELGQRAGEKVLEFLEAK